MFASSASKPSKKSYNSTKILTWKIIFAAAKKYSPAHTRGFAGHPGLLGVLLKNHGLLCSGVTTIQLWHFSSLHSLTDSSLCTEDCPWH